MGHLACFAGEFEPLFFPIWNLTKIKITTNYISDRIRLERERERGKEKKEI